MKIVFAGSPEFSVPVLEKLLDCGKHVVAVITQPDKPTGRKKTLTPTPVKACALKRGLPVYEFKKIRDEVQTLKALGADIMITCAYGQILSREVLNSFAGGVWNIHTSLLPKFRGASPVQSAILAGESHTGVTVMKTEEELDAGGILLVKRCEIGDMTCGELTQRLSAMGAEAALEAVELLERGDVQLLMQDEAKVTFCKKVFKDDAKIDFGGSSAHIRRLIKAFSPEPAAFCRFGESVLNIYNCELCDIKEGKAGEVVRADKHGIAVKCGEGGILITELQPAGGKRMRASDFVNGRKIKVGDLLNNPLCDPYLVLNKVYCGGKYLKQSMAETAIEPLHKARTVKICYGVLEKDIFLDWIISANAEKKPKSAVKLIIKIALYMLEFMGKRDYMVVDFAVELTKKLGKDGAAGFVNAFLRSYKIPALPQKTDERLSIECSAPLWLVKKLRRSYKGEAAEILGAPSKGICVRFERGEQNYLSKPHIKTPFAGAYIFENFVRDEGFYSGDYTFQSVGSVAICSAISPCERLLDACAAPGGKSVLLSKKCGSITACELHGHRVELIKQYAQRMGAENVCAVCADSTVFNPEYEETFDAVLCDAPCSGTGVIDENPDIKLFRKEEDIAALAEIQLKILDNCSRYVKKGGVLYYSTCSVLPEENDSAAYEFLRLHPEYASVSLTSPLENRATKFGLQFLPHISLGAGFYISSFKKL